MLLQLDKDNVKRTGEIAINKLATRRLNDKSELAQVRKDSNTTHEKQLEDEQCTICLEEFEVGCEYKVLDCNHIYHSEVSQSL